MASYDLGQLGMLEQQYDKQLQQCLHRKHHWEKMKADYEALSDRLSTISDKISHEIMVPMGSLAFMPGKIVHTNEITVLLGDNWFVERSAKQAMDIVNRRMITCRNMLKDLDTEQEHILKWMKYSNEAKGEGDLVEIREEYVEEQDQKWRKQHRENVRKHKQLNKTRQDDDIHEDLMEKLDKLQIDEEVKSDVPESESATEQVEVSNHAATNLIRITHTETTKSETQLTSSTPYSDLPIIESPSDIYKHFGIPTSETKSILKRRDSIKDEDGKKNHVRFADEELAKPEKEYAVAQPKTQTAFSGVIVEKTPESSVTSEVYEDTKTTHSVFKQRKLDAQVNSGNQNVASSNIKSTVNESFQSPNVQETPQIQNRPRTAFSAILERSTIEPVKPNDLKESKRPVSKFKAQRSRK